MVKKRYRKSLKLLAERLKYRTTRDGIYTDLFIEQGERLSWVVAWRDGVAREKLYYYHDNFYYPLESGMEFCIKLLLKNGLKRKIEHNDFEKKV